MPITNVAYITALPDNQEYKECPAFREGVAELDEENANVFYLPSASAGSLVSIHSFFFLLILLLLLFILKNTNTLKNTNANSRFLPSSQSLHTPSLHPLQT